MQINKKSDSYILSFDDKIEDFPYLDTEGAQPLQPLNLRYSISKCFFFHLSLRVLNRLVSTIHFTRIYNYNEFYRMKDFDTDISIPSIINIFRINMKKNLLLYFDEDHDLCYIVMLSRIAPSI